MIVRQCKIRYIQEYIKEKLFLTVLSFKKRARLSYVVRRKYKNKKKIKRHANIRTSLKKVSLLGMVMRP